MLGGGRRNVPAGVPESRHWLWDGALRPDGPVVIDSLTLTAREWATLAPPRHQVGSAWAVPESVARQFCRVLIPISDQSAMPRPDDAKLARLEGTVESVEDGLARIRLTGTWEAVHLQEGDAKRPLRGAATAEGVAIYDVKRQALQSVLLVFSGSYGRPNDESVGAVGAVVEWQSKRPALTTRLVSHAQLMNHEGVARHAEIKRILVDRICRITWVPLRRSRECRRWQGSPFLPSSRGWIPSPAPDRYQPHRGPARGRRTGPLSSAV